MGNRPRLRRLLHYRPTRFPYLFLRLCRATCWYYLPMVAVSVASRLHLFGTPPRLRSVSFQPIWPVSELYKGSPLSKAEEHKFWSGWRESNPHTTFVCLVGSQVPYQWTTPAFGTTYRNRTCLPGVSCQSLTTRHNVVWCHRSGTIQPLRIFNPSLIHLSYSGINSLLVGWVSQWLTARS